MKISRSSAYGICEVLRISQNCAKARFLISLINVKPQCFGYSYCHSCGAVFAVICLTLAARMKMMIN